MYNLYLNPAIYGYPPALLEYPRVGNSNRHRPQRKKLPVGAALARRAIFSALWLLVRRRILILYGFKVNLPKEKGRIFHTDRMPGEMHRLVDLILLSLILPLASLEVVSHKLPGLPSISSDFASRNSTRDRHASPTRNWSAVSDGSPSAESRSGAVQWINRAAELVREQNRAFQALGNVDDSHNDVTAEPDEDERGGLRGHHKRPLKTPECEWVHVDGGPLQHQATGYYHLSNTDKMIWKREGEGSESSHKLKTQAYLYYWEGFKDWRVGLSSDSPDAWLTTHDDFDKSVGPCDRSHSWWTWNPHTKSWCEFSSPHPPVKCKNPPSNFDPKRNSNLAPSSSSLEDSQSDDSSIEPPLGVVRVSSEPGSMTALQVIENAPIGADTKAMLTRKVTEGEKGKSWVVVAMVDVEGIQVDLRVSKDWPEDSTQQDSLVDSLVKTLTRALSVTPSDLKNLSSSNSLLDFRFRLGLGDEEKSKKESILVIKFVVVSATISSNRSNHCPSPASVLSNIRSITTKDSMEIGSLPPIVSLTAEKADLNKAYGAHRPGLYLFGHTVRVTKSASASHCFSHCAQEPTCAMYRWRHGDYNKDGSKSPGTCVLMGPPQGEVSDGDWILGCVSRPESVPVMVEVDVHKPIRELSDRYLSFNIDTSSNREFFQRNLVKKGDCRRKLSNKTDAKMSREQEKVVRAVSRESGYFTQECLNMALWRDLNTLVQAGDIDLVFGLNDLKRKDNSFDPSNVKELLQYSIKHGYRIWGLELGNELNEDLDPETQAKDLNILHNVLKNLYPPNGTLPRPKLLGPDPHSFKDKPGNYDNILRYLLRYLKKVNKDKTPLYAVTYHEYIEVDGGNILTPDILDLSQQIAMRLTETLSPHLGDAQLWAGEIGPHNGGSPPCSHNSLRWANFSNGFWFLNTLGTKAVHRTDAFCRQDLVGADYGMLDCSTLNPLPDFYNALIWKKVMGSRVLNVTSVNRDHIKAYAHCTQGSKKGVSMVILNLSLRSVPVVIRLKGLKGDTQVERTTYQLTGPDGIYGHKSALNGKTLEILPGPKLPEVQGIKEVVALSSPLKLPPVSYAFVVLSGDEVSKGADACA
ncbi:hypothetical protein AAMO2058_000324100 [Amorphochlora amoebiformis]